MSDLAVARRLPTAPPTDATRADFDRACLLLSRRGRIPGLDLSHRDFRVLIFLLGQVPGYFAHLKTIAEALDSSANPIGEALSALLRAGLVVWWLIPPHHKLSTGQYARTNVNRYWVNVRHLLFLLTAGNSEPATPLKSAASTPLGKDLRSELRATSTPPQGEPLPPESAEPEREAISKKDLEPERPEGRAKVVDSNAVAASLPPSSVRHPPKREHIRPKRTALQTPPELDPVLAAWRKLNFGEPDERSIRALVNRMTEGATTEQLEAAVIGAANDDWLRRRAKVPFAVVFATIASIERFAHQGRKVVDARDTKTQLEIETRHKRCEHERPSESISTRAPQELLELIRSARKPLPPGSITDRNTIRGTTHKRQSGLGALESRTWQLLIQLATALRIRRTDVRPMMRRRAISALDAPSRKSRSTCLALSDAERGRPKWRPSRRACSMPALTRSRRISRSNSANTATMPAIARPVGVVRSNASVRETKATPSSASLRRVSTRSDNERPQRSSLHTTTASISRTAPSTGGVHPIAYHHLAKHPSDSRPQSEPVRPDNLVEPECVRPVCKLAEFVNVLLEVHALFATNSPELGQRVFWYRGHSNAAWPLEPSLLRQPYAALARDYDAKFQTGFLARGATLFGKDLPECAVRRYALMQHHGFPTRLLDWTESSLIALYFAVRGQSGLDSAVWVLDSDALSGIGPFQNRPFPPFGPVYEMESIRDLVDWRVGKIHAEAIADFVPVPLVPSHFGLRDTVQRGRFTLHDYSPGALDTLSRELAFGSARIRTLVKIRVPNEFRSRIRDELLHFGVTETSVYPDLEGLARELRFLASSGIDDPFR